MAERTSMIKLSDRFYLKMDSFCMWIEEEYEVGEGKAAGTKAYKRVSGYTKNLEHLFNSFAEGQIKAGDIQGFRKGLEKVMEREQKK